MSTDNKQSLPAITLAAIGVVYGDIGTSPLYTLRECLSGQFGFGVERDAVFGFLSLIFWLLIFVVSNGFGHGVGMSQCGMVGYAQEQGMGYRDILRHYYTGVSFGTVGSGSSNGGLFGWLWSLLGL